MAAPGVTEVAAGRSRQWQPLLPGPLDCSSPTRGCRGNLCLRTWEGPPRPEPRPQHTGEGWWGRLTGASGHPHPVSAGRSVGQRTTGEGKPCHACHKGRCSLPALLPGREQDCSAASHAPSRFLCLLIHA